jgi:hypothetical protein
VKKEKGIEREEEVIKYKGMIDIIVEPCFAFSGSY